jgi:hypothetical protein
MGGLGGEGQDGDDEDAVGEEKERGVGVGVVLQTMVTQGLRDVPSLGLSERGGGGGVYGEYMEEGGVYGEYAETWRYGEIWGSRRERGDGYKWEGGGLEGVGGGGGVGDGGAESCVPRGDAPGAGCGGDEMVWMGGGRGGEGVGGAKAAVLVYHSWPQGAYAEEWLQEFVDSISRQTMRDFDVWEMDYSSTGNLSLARRYNMLLPRGYKWMHQHHRTHSGAINRLLDLIQPYNYKVVFNTHVDDVYAQQRFALQYSLITLGGRDLVSSAFQYLHSSLDTPTSSLRAKNFTLDVLLQPPDTWRERMVEWFVQGEEEGWYAQGGGGGGGGRQTGLRYRVGAGNNFFFNSGESMSRPLWWRCMCKHTHTHTQTHKHIILREREKERERERDSKVRSRAYSFWYPERKREREREREREIWFGTILHKVGSRAYSDIQGETERERESARERDRERERERERDSDIEGASQEAHSAQRFWHLTSGRDFFLHLLPFFSIYTFPSRGFSIPARYI